MKRAATLLIVGIFILGNTLTANAKTYRATQTNSNGQVEIVTICKGNDHIITEPLRQYKMKYNTDGNLVEKIVYSWIYSESKWVEHIAYKFEYNTTNQLIELQYSKWDEKNLAWNNTELTVFSEIKNDKLLTINYLNSNKY